jgi:adenylosuccinate synthase
LVSFPSSIEVQENLECKFESFKGWNTDITKCKSMNELPKEAREYISFIESFTNVHVSIVSVGPDREETIIL